MRTWWTKLRAAFSRHEIDHDLDEEIEAHLQMEAEAREERGMPRGEARAAARREFGNRTSIRESARDAWAFEPIETLVRDLCYGVRLLRRSPSFTITAVAVIGLGSGASTTAFALLDHVLVRPLPFENPDRLVMLYETQPANGVPRLQTSPPNFLDWRSLSKSFDAMGAYFSILFPMNLSGTGEPQRVDSAIVDSEVFRALGARPAAGRVFNAGDDRVGSANVAILSYSLAIGLFGSADGAVGRTIDLDGQAHTIVGVMPASFAFPSRNAQAWRPLRFSPGFLASRSNHILYAVARLRPGVSMDAARAEMNVVAAQLQRAYPKDNARSEIAVVRVRDMMSPQSRMLVLGMFGGAVCLLLIACTNLANLLLARSLVRSREIAVRMAIGAGRGRIVRQFLAESLLIAIAGGLAGIALTTLVTPLLARLVPTALPVEAMPAVDWRIVGFAGALTIAMCLAFGVAPAFQACRTPDLSSLRSRTRENRRRSWLRGSLVATEIAGTIVLIVAAGLLLKALWRVQNVETGFRADGVLTLRTTLPAAKYGTSLARQRFYSQILDNARALPGVLSAGYVSYHPLEPTSGRLPVIAPGFIDDPQRAPSAIIHFITPGFFDTLGIPIVRGRDIDDRDGETAPFAAIVSESLAERLWPGQDPLGRPLRTALGERTVVGVARSIVVRSLEGRRDPQIYFPATQLGTMSIYYAPKDLLVRVDGDPSRLATALAKIVRDVDPAQSVADVRPLTDVVSLQTASRRDQAAALGTFAFLAALLAAVGIYGLLAFTVSARTQEIGIRIALGASRRRILGMFLRQAFTLGCFGILVAIPLAYAAARGMSALLFGVNPADPVIFAAAIAVASAMTIAGSLYPALRAASIDPTSTIRMANAGG
jgi:predicted permease